MQKVYYANCRLNGTTALLAGPFLTATEAEEAMEIVGPVAVKDRKDLAKASFGVMQCNAPGSGAGYYNSHLPQRLILALAMAADGEGKLLQ